MSARRFLDGTEVLPCDAPLVRTPSQQDETADRNRIFLRRAAAMQIVWKHNSHPHAGMAVVAMEVNGQAVRRTLSQ